MSSYSFFSEWMKSLEALIVKPCVDRAESAEKVLNSPRLGFGVLTAAEERERKKTQFPRTSPQSPPSPSLSSFSKSALAESAMVAIGASGSRGIAARRGSKDGKEQGNVEEEKRRRKKEKKKVERSRRGPRDFFLLVEEERGERSEEEREEERKKREREKRVEVETKTEKKRSLFFTLAPAMPRLS